MNEGPGRSYAAKEEMIQTHLIKRGIKDKAVLRAMETVERKIFVPAELEDMAYEDAPLPIGRGQTISQPYIVAFMAEALRLDGSQRVLEVGSGCGYNAAILGELAQKVYTVEIVEWLAQLAQKNLDAHGSDNVFIKLGDGYRGWPEKAPFDAIALTAACPEIPAPLKEQLKIGGRLLAPVGTLRQELILLEKLAARKYRQKTLLPVKFVSMTGAVQKEARERMLDKKTSSGQWF